MATSTWMVGSRKNSLPGTTLAMPSMRNTPSTRPIHPASAVMKTASRMTWPTTLAGVAPKALRMPISRVRSFTTMSMMLLTPTMPAMSEPMPTNQRKAVIPLKMLLMVPTFSTLLFTHSARSSVGSKS